MGVSSTRGIRVPEDRRLVVYVLMCTLGREDGAGSWGGLRAAVVVEVREEGVGAQETLMTCWRPWRQMESTTSPLKKSSSIDFSWMYCGWVSKSSDAKCISGLWPGVDLGVYWRDAVKTVEDSWMKNSNLEFVHACPTLDTHFYHVEYTAIIHSDEREAVRSLFSRLPNDKERCIVFGCPKL